MEQADWNVKLCRKCLHEHFIDGECILADDVNHPPHYTASNVEPIDVIEAWCLPYHLGNVIKYLARCRHKGHELEDLKKARWYLDRFIAKLEREGL